MNLAPFGRTCSRIHLNPVHPVNPVNPVNPVKKNRQDNRIKQDTSRVNPWFQHKKNANSYTIKLYYLSRMSATSEKNHATYYNDLTTKL
jgi:hypothetical protein